MSLAGEKAFLEIFVEQSEKGESIEVGAIKAAYEEKVGTQSARAKYIICWRGTDFAKLCHKANIQTTRVKRQLKPQKN